jgi:hypothetical protein
MYVYLFFNKINKLKVLKLQWKFFTLVQNRFSWVLSFTK